MNYDELGDLREVTGALKPERPRTAAGRPP